MKTNILGVPFDNVLPEQAVSIALTFLDDVTTSIIFTPNPEIVMLSQKDKELSYALSSANLLIPDGIGIVYASRLTSNKIKKRVPGIEFCTDLFSKITNTTHSMFFLGAAPNVAETAAKKIKECFSGISIVGTHNGFFKDNETPEIIKKINASGADIVLVGLGFPRQQETWIFQHKDQFNAKIIIGVGGSFDVWSGRIPRAPKVFQKLGLEWFFRLLRQPKRIWRQRVLIKFAILVVYKKIRGEL